MLGNRTKIAQRMVFVVVVVYFILFFLAQYLLSRLFFIRKRWDSFPMLDSGYLLSDLYKNHLFQN